MTQNSHGRRRRSEAHRRSLYSVSRYLDSSSAKEVGLTIPLTVYLQDPLVAARDPRLGLDDEFHVPWEPHIADGPTSSRFAVVDYNGDAGHLEPKATWDVDNDRFLDPDGKVLDRDNVKPLQFHQVNVWAVLQRALAFFEHGEGLGRSIPFAFEGNRLIVVPHAGYGKNAFYDRASKSLQFYYFDHEDKPIYTCLSADIVSHEFGHAVLDGMRPYYFESSSVQTNAFHEFIGDLTAILIGLRGTPPRDLLGDSADYLANIAEEVGEAIDGKPGLRSARRWLTMSDVAGESGPHLVSEVLTGAMFDMLQALARHYGETRDVDARRASLTVSQLMQRLAIPPLDLLPPVEVTFKDYALAVLRADALANPTDPYGRFDLMLEVFHAREILDAADLEEFRQPRSLYENLRLSVFHDVEDFSRSRAAAYRFLDDNRAGLFIPAHRDLIVADLYDATKLTRQGSRLPRQIVLEYVWREDLVLEGERFGEFEGESATMLCGGTVVFDESGNALSWSRKPGTEGDGRHWEKELAAGEARRQALLDDLSKRIRAGEIGAALGSSRGMLGSHIPPLTVRRVDGSLRFELSPHLNLKGEKNSGWRGGRRWEASS